MDGASYRQARRMKDFVVTAEDFNSIADAVFQRIDPKGDIKVVVIPATLDPRAVAAIKKERPVIPFVEPSASATEILPAGYFLLHTFSIERVDADAMATIEGQLGPVTRTMTAAGLPDCGKIYSVLYVLNGDEWQSSSYKIETCTEKRIWFPVDAPQTGSIQ